MESQVNASFPSTVTPLTQTSRGHNKALVWRYPYYRGRVYMEFGLCQTKSTACNRGVFFIEVSVRRGSAALATAYGKDLQL